MRRNPRSAVGARTFGARTWATAVVLAAAACGLAACNTDRSVLGGSPEAATPAPAGRAAAPKAVPLADMAGRWVLGSPGAGQCSMTFSGAPGAVEGTVAPEGGCPGKFFTSRRWLFDQGLSGDPQPYRRAAREARRVVSRPLRWPGHQWRGCLAGALAGAPCRSLVNLLVIGIACCFACSYCFPSFLLYFIALVVFRLPSPARVAFPDTAAALSGNTTRLYLHRFEFYVKTAPPSEGMSAIAKLRRRWTAPDLADMVLRPRADHDAGVGG